MRTAGRRARPRRRARNGRGRRDRHPGRRADARGVRRRHRATRCDRRSTPAPSAATPSASAATRFGDEMAALDRASRGARGKPPQPPARRLPRPLRRAARRHRVHHRLRSVPQRSHQPASSRSPRACRRCSSTSTCCRSSPSLVPLGFQLQGLYRLRRGRSRVDDFFAVFVGSILAVVFGIVATLYVQTYFATDAAQGSAAPSKSRSSVWAIFLVLNVAADVRVARAGARGARAALARRHRPQADPDRRIRRARPPGRRQDPRAPRARLSDRRLRRRQGGGRSPRLPRPAAARHASTRRPRSRRAKRSITSTSRCRPSSTCRCSSCIESTSREMRRRQGGAGSAAGHRAARAARGSRRRPGHQHQRRPAAGLQRDRQARASTSRSPAAALVVLAHPARRSSRALVKLTSRGAGVLPPGADGARRQAVHDRTSSARCTTTPSAETGPVWASERRSARDAARPVPAPLEPRRAAAALERAARRHVDRRPASRAAALRRAVQAQDSAVHAAPQGEGRHHRLGAGQRLARQHARSRSGSSTISTTSRTGRCVSI